MCARILLWPVSPRPTCFIRGERTPGVMAGGPGDPFIIGEVPPDDEREPPPRPDPDLSRLGAAGLVMLGLMVLAAAGGGWIALWLAGVKL